MTAVKKKRTYHAIRTLQKFLIESADSSGKTLDQVFKNQFGQQNKNLEDEWSTTPTLTVVTDFNKNQLADILQIPVGKISDQKRLRIADLYVFAVQDENLLKDSEFKSKIKLKPSKEPTNTGNKQKNE